MQAVLETLERLTGAGIGRPLRDRLGNSEGGRDSV